MNIDKLERDQDSNAVLNKNGIGLDNYRAARAVRHKKSKTIVSLEDRVQKLETLVENLIKRIE